MGPKSLFWGATAEFTVLWGSNGPIAMGNIQSKTPLQGLHPAELFCYISMQFNWQIHLVHFVAATKLCLCY